jgi:flagellar hook-length control protein FliK
VTGTAAAEPVRGTERAPSAPDTTVVDQVTRHLVAARVLRDGTHHTVLHLAPEHLGELTVTVDVRQGAVRLDVLGSGSALTALGQDLDSLRSQLADAGLDLADVSMRSDDAPADGGRNGQQPTDRQNQPGSTGNAAAEGFDRPGTGRQGRMTDVAAQGSAAGPTTPAEPEPVAATGPSSTSRTGTGLLDVRV